MTALLIKNARVFAPQDLGKNDVLMVNDRIAAVGQNLAPQLPDLEILDASGKILTPGFFDQHIHVTGGGGEGGPSTRTPELVLSELISCGTTSVVGVSGTDYTTRSIPNLLAKVRALQTEGVSAWMYTSNYKYPATTLTDSIANDLFFVPEVIGVKIALGDHRSSFPTTQQVLAVLAEVRVGAMIAGTRAIFRVPSRCMTRSWPRGSRSNIFVQPIAAVSVTFLILLLSSARRAAGLTLQPAHPAASIIPLRPLSKRSAWGLIRRI